MTHHTNTAFNANQTDDTKIGPNEIHVWPCEDALGHILIGTTCPCQPRFEYHLFYRSPLFVHKRYTDQPN